MPAAAPSTRSTCGRGRSGRASGYPGKYLSVAPGLPPGYLLLGYTESGACPVLIGGRCTIYEDRPLVCRTYDCRMYAATGVTPDRAEIAAQVRRWRFGYRSAEDRALHDAVLAAVRFIGEQPACLPSDAARAQPIRVATLAVSVHELFLEGAVIGVRRTARQGPGPRACGGQRQRGALRRRLTPLGRPAYPVGRRRRPPARVDREGRDGQRAFHPRARHGRPASASHRHLSAG